MYLLTQQSFRLVSYFAPPSFVLCLSAQHFVPLSLRFPLSATCFGAASLKSPSKLPSSCALRNSPLLLSVILFPSSVARSIFVAVERFSQDSPAPRSLQRSSFIESPIALAAAFTERLFAFGISSLSSLLEPHHPLDENASVRLWMRSNPSPPRTKTQPVHSSQKIHRHRYLVFPSRLLSNSHLITDATLYEWFYQNISSPLYFRARETSPAFTGAMRKGWAQARPSMDLEWNLLLTTK